MNEGEFRDWARGQLRSLDERLKAAAARAEAPRPKAELDQQIQGSIAKLVETLTLDVKGGKVAGLAIAYVNDEDVTYTGFAADGGYFALAGAATFIGLELLEQYRKDWRAAQSADQAAAE
jgi:hypothetical protein